MLKKVLAIVLIISIFALITTSFCYASSENINRRTAVVEAIALAAIGAAIAYNRQSAGNNPSTNSSYSQLNNDDSEEGNNEPSTGGCHCC